MISLFIARDKELGEKIPVGKKRVGRTSQTRQKIDEPVTILHVMARPMFKYHTTEWAL